jgi:hypothetical protein
MSIANLDEAQEIINLKGKKGENKRMVFPRWYVVVQVYS